MRYGSLNSLFQVALYLPSLRDLAGGINPDRDVQRLGANFREKIVFCSISWFALELVGIRRLVVQIKAVNKSDLAGSIYHHRDVQRPGKDPGECRVQQRASVLPQDGGSRGE